MLSIHQKYAFNPVSRTSSPSHVPHINFTPTQRGAGPRRTSERSCHSTTRVASATYVYVILSFARNQSDRKKECPVCTTSPYPVACPYVVTKPTPSRPQLSHFYAFRNEQTGKCRAPSAPCFRRHNSKHGSAARCLRGPESALSRSCFPLLLLTLPT
jgi:hypothetical protein